jgi:hypothetical protein
MHVSCICELASQHDERCEQREMAMQEAASSAGDTSVNPPDSHHVRAQGRRHQDYQQTRLRHGLKVEMCYTAWFLRSYLMAAINMKSKAIIFLINTRDNIKPDLTIRIDMTVVMLRVLPRVVVQVKQKPINDVKEEEPFHQVSQVQNRCYQGKPEEKKQSLDESQKCVIPWYVHFSQGHQQEDKEHHRNHEVGRNCGSVSRKQLRHGHHHPADSQHWVWYTP